MKDQLTQQIIGCCFTVHRELGPGFPEKVYQAALLASLEAAGVTAERERQFDVAFDGVQVGEFRIDLVVEGRVIVEVKAITGVMPKVFLAQVLAYLKAASLPVGLLVNFGNASCQVKRVSLSTLPSSAKSVVHVAR